MKLTPLRIVGALVLAMILISVLGGTAIWRVLGFGDHVVAFALPD